MKILDFGSLNYDYVYSVEHVVVPGETISSLDMEIFCGGKGLNQAIAAAGQAWGVSIPAQAAGLQALKEEGFPQKTREYIGRQKAILRACLEEQGFIVYGSQANYLFFKVPKNLAFGEKMEKHGILVRSCANYHGLGEQFYRIAVKSEQENARFVEAVSRIFAE